MRGRDWFAGGVLAAVLVMLILINGLRGQVDDLTNAVNALESRFPGDPG